MKKIFLLTSIIMIGLFSTGCATWDGVQADSSDAWETTKEVSQDTWEATKEAVNEASSN